MKRLAKTVGRAGSVMSGVLAVALAQAASAEPAMDAPANCEWRHQTIKGADVTLLYCLKDAKFQVTYHPKDFGPSTLAQARGGDAAAMVAAGVFYISETSMSARDVDQGVRWFRKAADAGAPAASFDLALAYRKGLGVPADVAEERRLLEKAAGQGSVSAKLNLARVLYLAPPDAKADAQLAQLVREAAQAEGELGDKARVDMGVLCSAGRGVAPDGAEAVRWWRMGADKNYAEAQGRLALAYAEGAGVPKDDELALEWFRKSTKSTVGFIDSMISLATTIFKPDRLVALYGPQAESGDPMAIMTLASYYSSARPAEAVRLYKLGAEKGIPFAKMKLAELYARGAGVPRDLTEAVRLYREAGHSTLQTFQGVDAFQSVASDTGK